LKNEEENEQVLLAFQHFLNSLDFSVQFLIHSRKINIEKYLNILREKEKEEKNELLLNQLREYIEFIKILVEDSTIMTKSFYVVIPWDVASIIEGSQSIAKKIKSFIGFKEKTKFSVKEDSELLTDFEQKKFQINQRSWVVEEGLQAIGLTVIPLKTEEIIELFYNLYNPALVERADLKIAESLQ